MPQSLRRKLEEVKIDINMKNPRLYGSAPFNIAVIHGGPGAPGEMAPVARELSSLRGVLEPLQTAVTPVSYTHLTLPTILLV